MKKVLFIFALFLFLPSIIAASYTQTAAEVSPGVFAEGTYAFPSTVVIGDDENPYSYSPAIALGEGGDQYGMYYNGDAYRYGLYIASQSTTDATAIYAYSKVGDTILAVSDDTTSSSAAVYGYADDGATAIYGYSSSGAPAVYGYNADATGVGVKAYSTYTGFYTSGASYGLYVPDSSTYGVLAYSDSIGGKFHGDTYGVYASGDYVGGYFSSDILGVYGQSSSSTTKQCGVKGLNSASGNAGYMGCYNYGLYTPDGAKVEGALSVGSCSGCSDIAENLFGEDLEAGDVVVLDPSKKSGVKKTAKQYDKLAAGIVSTDPTITMGLGEGVPVALSGVVPTKVIGKIKLGDLLTTSSTAGYAMACTDYQKCQGAIIGKAMEENSGGKATITALVMLG